MTSLFCLMWLNLTVQNDVNFELEAKKSPQGYNVQISLNNDNRNILTVFLNSNLYGSTI